MTDQGKQLRIAIDGPGGSGKSTAARRIAADLRLTYVDTGAMYRAVGIKMKRLGLPFEDGPSLVALLEETDLDYRDGKMYMDGEDVSQAIRSQEASMLASACSALPSTRRKLTAIQKRMADEQSLVMDGRDIGTHVIPRAEVKFFLTATAEERARRRCAELKKRGDAPDFAHVLQETIQRDKNDSTRPIDPLRPAEDALIIDSTALSEDQVVRLMEEVIRERGFVADL